MRFRHQIAGAKLTVVALELDNKSCPAIEYLRDLKARDADSHESMHGRIKYRADQLTITNRMISRPLTGKPYQGLYRLSTKSERLVYCFVKGGMVVLLNGYTKTDNEKSAWERGRQYKSDLETQLAKGVQP